MALSLLDNVRFQSSTSGTGSFTYASAVAGYQSPTLGGAVDNTPADYFAISADLTQWEIGRGTWSIGTGTTLARVTVYANSSGTGTLTGQSGVGSHISFTTNPTVAIVMLAADVLHIDGNQQLTGGFAQTAYDDGTFSSGTLTLNPYLGNLQYLHNAGAFTIHSPSIDCEIDLLIVNSTGAGAITMVGFAVSSSPGDPLTTTSGSIFLMTMHSIGGVSTYIIKALQ